MRRRQFLELGALALARASGQQKAPSDTVTASASQQRTPRVGIVLSSFRRSTDHDGTPLEGLADPQPVAAVLSTDQMDAMVRKAIELGTSAQGGLAAIVGPEDWVVIKPNIVACHGLGPDDHDGGAHHRYIPGTVTDLRVVRSLISFLVEHKRGLRITIAEGSGEWLPAERSKSPIDGWSTNWGGAFGGLSYKSMIDDFSRRYPGVQFELLDLNFAATTEMPVPGAALAKQNAAGVYHVPKAILQCDRVISVAPLKTHTLTGVSLSLKNYFGIGPGEKYGFPKSGLHKLDSPDDVLVDLFSYHPADYAILGGSWGVEGDGPFFPGARSVHHNVVIAGADAVAVDAVGAGVMGFRPSEIRHLHLAESKGFGIPDLDLIWTRGNSIEEARRLFRKPRRGEIE
ncbi:MAG: DUF362 domain-containing protein [Acidobacteria bacterium]|nr:DUF362 domain-containing protein [Acidobacteriota bacterium]